MSEHCFCGRPLHYTNPKIEILMQSLVSRLGTHIKITLQETGRSFMVPRHYVALHGLKATELPELGFEEI